MTGASVLAGELDRAGSDHHAAFRPHERRLRPFLAHKQASARNFAAASAPRTRVGVRVRNRVSRLLGLLPVADFFVGRDLRDDLELPGCGM